MLSRMRRRLFREKGEASPLGTSGVYEAPPPQAFCACTSGWLGSLGRTHPERGRGRKPQSPSREGLGGAENKKGKVEVIQIGGRPSPLPFPPFSHLLGQLQGHSKHPLDLCTCFPLTIAQRTTPIPIVRQALVIWACLRKGEDGPSC